MTVVQHLTSSLADVTESIFDLLTEAKGSLGVIDVWYGDQSLYPNVPALAVEPLAVDRVIAGSGLGGNVENMFGVYIYIFHGTLSEVQESRRMCERLASDVEKFMNKHLQLNGEIIHGFVTKNESGQALRGQLLGVTRLTWEGLSKTLLGA